MTIKAYVLLALCALTNGQLLRRPILDGRIVGGEDADIQDYPYQVSLMYLDSHTCGASIISDQWVLTAAHCTDGKMAKYLKIRAGSSIRNDGGNIYTVTKIIQHPYFDGSTFDFDFSLLKIKNPISFGSNVKSVALTSREPAVGSLAVVSGWGRLSSGGALPDQLQVVSVPIVGRTECNEIYGSITDRMICAGYDKGGKDACQGDSGGPLVFNNELVGVVSWGYGCAAPRQPGIYSNVAGEIDWIKENCEQCF